VTICSAGLPLSVRTTKCRHAAQALFLLKSWAVFDRALRDFVSPSLRDWWPGNFSQMGHLGGPAMRRNEIGNAHVVQDVGHGVANPTHHETDCACLYICAVSTWLESGPACTSQWRQRPVDHANDVTDSYLARGSSQHVAASGPLLAEDEASTAEVAQDCIEELFRDVVPFGNFDSLHARPRLKGRKAYEGLQAVLSLCGQHVARLGL
jgi:hypothetical protein